MYYAVNIPEFFNSTAFCKANSRMVRQRHSSVIVQHIPCECSDTLQVSWGKTLFTEGGKDCFHTAEDAVFV